MIQVSHINNPIMTLNLSRKIFSFLDADTMILAPYYKTLTDKMVL